MNTEHTWSISWGPDTSATSADLHHLYPTLTTANAVRDSYRFGKVVNPEWQSGGSKLGTDANGAVVFEPRNAHKGNVARSTFYFAVRYSVSIDAVQERVLKQWNHDDPPDSAERARNSSIADIQKRRNPFIDFPARADRMHDF
jgi:endonuclease I